MGTGNSFLSSRNTFYWGKQACAYAYGDYTKANIYHWCHDIDRTEASGILESIKEPLESRVWYDYEGQTPNGSSFVAVGSSNKPAHVGRVLDDGSTQLYTYEYNGLGNVTKMVDPVGRTFSYIYAANGIDLLEVRQTRAGQSQLLSQATYNSQHLPLTAKDAAGQTTTYVYNARGQVLTQTNAKGDTTIFSYDADGHLSSVEGPLGTFDATTLNYDSRGRVRTKIDGSPFVGGYALTFDYDDLDRLTKITFPDATFDQFTYTRLDQTLMRDRAGRQTSFEYDNVRQMTKRTDPLNRTTLFEWCKCGALRRLTDPMSRTTTWRHDIQGRVKSKEYTDGSKIIYLYENTTSRLRQRIDEKLQVTQYNYNLDNTLSGKTYTNTVVATPAVVFNYDLNYKRTISMTDGTGKTHYGYIPITPIPTLGAGQLRSVASPLSNGTITYAYDELGRRNSKAINAVSSTVTFDAAGRVTSATNSLGMFSYTYEGSSFRETSQSYPNGLRAERSYADNLQDQKLQRITHRNGGTPISDFIYGRDVPTGQITSWSQQSDAQAPSLYRFSYDAADQLTSATVSQGASQVSTFNYSYDPAANRISEQIAAITINFSYNALNELTSADGAEDIIKTYRWDAEQRLVAVNSDNQSTQFTYDGLGRRVGIRQVLGGSEISNRQFIWCDNDICEERTPSGAVSKRFFEQGMTIETGPVTGTYFYTRDHLGSIRELIDSAGKIRARYTYDPFGRRTRLIGNLDADVGFAGLFWSVEAGFNLTWFRAYDPRICRWLSRDPLSNAEVDEQNNLFNYVRNDPVNLMDTMGLCCESEYKALMFGIDEAEAVINQAEHYALIVCGLGFTGLTGAARGLANSAIVKTFPIFGKVTGPLAAVSCGAALVAAAAVSVDEQQNVWSLVARYKQCMAAPCIRCPVDLPVNPVL